MPIEKALAHPHGLLCDARQLAHAAYLRRDPVTPELVGVRRIASQAVLSRSFAGFDSAGTNLRCFRPLWHRGLDRLPSRKEGCALDLDSTRLLHEDGHQQGVAVGCTRAGLKPCLHPLLAVIAEARLATQLWLRAGNSTCGGYATAFFVDLWERIHLPYVVVGQLSQPIQIAVVASPAAGWFARRETSPRERAGARRNGATISSPPLPSRPSLPAVEGRIRPPEKSFAA